MGDLLFDGNAMRVAKLALDGLSLRQQAISRNLANVDTPGYQAQTVDFAETLQRATQKDGSLPLKTTRAGHQTSPAAVNPGFSVTARPGGTFRADQNNVDVDREMLDMSEVGIQYEALSLAISKKLAGLKALAR
jgi:flagellar basal-body rod protein FlgB